jgi:tRNA (guanine-N7-)-methyltransferase
MPLKNRDPFASQLKNLNPGINPYVALMATGIEDGNLPVACGEMLKDFPGKWREKIASFYQRTTPFKKLVVEIGCHKGHVLCKMAAEHPETAFIGIDITYKRVVGTAERAQKMGLKNVFTVLANAKAIDMIFAPSEIDGVLIFFPDPWIKKKRQAKNRLVDVDFCKNLEPLLSEQAFCWFKTDQKVYFDQAQNAFVENSFRTQSESCEITRNAYTSIFEQRFTEQNLPTYGSKWLRSSQKSAAH